MTLFRWSVCHFSDPFVRKRDQIFASLAILEHNDRVGNGKFVGSVSSVSGSVVFSEFSQAEQFNDLSPMMHQ